MVRTQWKQSVGRVSLKKRQIFGKNVSTFWKGVWFWAKHCVGKNTIFCAKVNIWGKMENIKSAFFMNFGFKGLVFYWSTIQLTGQRWRTLLQNYLSYFNGSIGHRTNFWRRSPTLARWFKVNNTLRSIFLWFRVLVQPPTSGFTIISQVFFWVFAGGSPTVATGLLLAKFPLARTSVT